MEELTLFERINNWIKTSVTIKLVIIFFIVLLMLIPTVMIRSLISERKILSEETKSEVSINWASDQLITGPVMSIPVKKDANSILQYIHVLPDELRVTGSIEPRKLKRGIYEVIVYEAHLALNGFFNLNEKVDTDSYGEIYWIKLF
ncbi:MAG: inner membrane CreD family protein [Segetibacter sp.]|nr:inner membrane CreD family protein [Segetibacter sp.]